MRNKGNGQFRRFLFRAGGAARDNFAFIGHETVPSAAFNHKDGFRVHRHIAPARCAYPFNGTAAPTAITHFVFLLSRGREKLSPG